MSTSSSLHVRLFGDLDLRLGNERLAPVESARARSLLGYLLIHGDGPHPRQRLAFMLWPESTEAQARTNLRNVLHTLRSASPEIERILDVTPRTLQLRGDVQCWVDVAKFTTALGAAEAAEAGSDQMVAALRVAIELYVGDLLEGCYDEWLLAERERWRDRYTSALRRLTDALMERGQHAEAIRLGRELARCDPLHEDTYRLLMSMHAAAGDRAGAIRAYHECVATLQRELGVEPSAETRDSYAALMRSDAPTTLRGDRVRVSRAGLIGRDDEWETLTRCWRDTEAGRSQMVLVTGEPGVGKTRLVEELGAWCARRGALVAQARAYPTEGDLGYGLVISWLRTAGLAPQLRRAGPAELAELARLLPELGSPPGTVSEDVDEAEQRRRVYDAVARTLLASDRPILLVADDAQWCDAQSLQLIHYLVRLGPDSPLLVAATARREDLDDRHPLAALLGGLQIIDRTSEIALGRLTRADTEVLMRELSGRAPDAASVDELHAETEGSPLFIVESVRARSGSPASDGQPLSPKLHAVITARLRQLSEPAHELLGVAAAVGREFTADLARAASDLDDLTLVRGLDELWRRGLIREHGTDAYDFSHGKIRDAAYEELSPATRRRNHLLIADALVRLHDADLDVVSGQIARNYDGAGHAQQAVKWYQRAAVQAQHLHAAADAVRLFDRALALVVQFPEHARADCELELLSMLTTPLIGVEGFASTRMSEVQQRAVELAAVLGVEPEPELLRSLVMSSLCRTDFDGATAAATQLRSAARRAGDHGLLIESDYLLGIGAFWSGALNTAQVHFEQAVDDFHPADRADHLVRFGHDPQIVCLSRLANTLWLIGDTDAARHARDQALAMANEVRHPFTRGLAHIFAAVLAIDLDENDVLRDYVAVLAKDPTQARPNEIMTDALVGYTDVVDGRADAGVDRIRTAIDSFGPIDLAPGMRMVLNRLLVAALDAAGEAEGGLDAADAALRLGGSRLWEAEVRRLRAEFLVAVGRDRAEAEAELARADDVARQQGTVSIARRIERTRSRLLPAG